MCRTWRSEPRHKPRNCQKPVADFPLSLPEGAGPADISDSDFGLQNCEITHFCCLNHSVVFCYNVPSKRMQILIHLIHPIAKSPHSTFTPCCLLCLRRLTITSTVDSSNRMARTDYPNKLLTAVFISSRRPGSAVKTLVPSTECRV